MAAFPEEPTCDSLANKQDGATILLPVHVSPLWKVGLGGEVDKTYINPVLFDAAFAGRPLSCGKSQCREF